MSEMVERMVAAFLEALDKYEFYVMEGMPDQSYSVIDGGGDIRPAMRAAIAAMREPNEAMLEAGNAADWVGERESRAGLSIMPYTEMVPDDDADDYALVERTLPGIWPSMIDAALGKEG